MLVPSVEKTEWEIVTTPKPKKICTLTVKYTLMDGDSGETMEFTVLGQGEDSSDKATYKAMTGATKYALLKLFLIPTGDDPEDDTPPPSGQITAPRVESNSQRQATATTRTSAVKEQLAARAAERQGPSQDELWKKVVGIGSMFGRTETQMKTFVVGVLQTRRRLVEADVATIHDALVQVAKPIVGGDVK